MADSVVTGSPFVLKHPVIKIGATGSSVDIACPATNVEFSPDQDENTVETFCGTYTTYKPPTWTLTATIAQSYGATGTWNLLQPMMDTIQPYQIQPDNGPISASNPVASGTGYVRAFAFIDGGPGEVSEVDVVVTGQGQPLFGVVAPTMEETAADTTPAA